MLWPSEVTCARVDHMSVYACGLGEGADVDESHVRVGERRSGGQQREERVGEQEGTEVAARMCERSASEGRRRQT